MDSEFSKKEEVLSDLYNGNIKITNIVKCECKTVEEARAGLKELIPVTHTFTEEAGNKTLCFVCQGAVGTVCYRLGSEKDSKTQKYAHKNCLGCMQCNKVTGSYIIEDDGLVRCGNCGVSCKACGGPIVGEGTWLIALERKWHPGCLICAQCQKSLEERCIEYRGKAYCPDVDGLCLRKYFGLACNSCGLPLDGSCSRLANKYFHNDCVSCSRCHERIIGLDFYPVNGHPFCDKCSTEYFNEV